MLGPAGSTDTYYRNTAGKRFRSIKAVLEHIFMARPAAASIKAKAAFPASLQQPSSAHGPQLQSPVSHRTSKLIIKGSMLRADAGQAGAVGPTSAGRNYGSLSAIMKPSGSGGPKAELEGALVGSSEDGDAKLSPSGQPASSPAQEASKQDDKCPAPASQTPGEFVKAGPESVDAAAGARTDARKNGEAAANEAGARQPEPEHQQRHLTLSTQQGSTRREPRSEPPPLV